MLRANYTGGPAYLTWNGLTLQLAEDWQAEITEEVTERRTSLHGLVGHNMDYRIGRVTGKPVATSATLATMLAKLHPYKASDKGAKLSTKLGGADLPAVIQTADGRSITFNSAFLTKMPDINFAPNKEIFGDFELTCLVQDNGSLGTVANYIAEASSAYTAPTLDPTTLISEMYSIAWGSTSPFDAIETTEDGLVLSPALETEELKTQRDGLLDWRINDVTAEVKFTPVNVSSAHFLSLVTAVARGGLMGAAGLALTVQQGSGTGGPKLEAQLAVPTQKSLRFGEGSRAGEVTMRLERKFATSLQERYALSVKSA